MNDSLTKKNSLGNTNQIQANSGLSPKSIKQDSLQRKNCLASASAEKCESQASLHSDTVRVWTRDLSIQRLIYQGLKAAKSPGGQWPGQQGSVVRSSAPKNRLETTGCLLRQNLKTVSGRFYCLLVRESAKPQKQKLEKRMFMAEDQGGHGKSAPGREMSWRPLQSKLLWDSLSR